MATAASDPNAPGAAFVSMFCNTSDVYVDVDLADAERGPLAHMKDRGRPGCGRDEIKLRLILTHMTKKSTVRRVGMCTRA